MPCMLALRRAGVKIVQIYKTRDIVHFAKDPVWGSFK